MLVSMQTRFCSVKPRWDAAQWHVSSSLRYTLIRLQTNQCVVWVLFVATFGRCEEWSLCCFSVYGVDLNAVGHQTVQGLAPFVPALLALRTPANVDHVVLSRQHARKSGHMLSGRDKIMCHHFITHHGHA